MKLLYTIVLLAVGFAACGQTSNQMEGYSQLGKIYGPDEALPIEMEMTEQEWKERLDETQYYILRQRGTERAFTGKHWNNKDAGTYYSAATGQALFRSDAKYDSGCGWPSFFEPIEEGAILYREDTSHGMRRVEILDSKSGSHLGHVFNDGPPPTGLRYCLNSEAMIFVPDGEDPADHGVPGFEQP